MNNNQFGASAVLPGALPISAAKSGATYSIFGSPTLAAPAAVAPVIGQVVYTPIFVPFTITVSKLGVIAGAPSSNTLRFALYAIGADGLPGSLIYDFGSNGSGSGLSAAASSAPQLTRGWYYLAVNANSTSASIYGYAPSSVPSLIHSGLIPSIAAPTSGLAPLNAASLSYGAFPSTATTPTTSFANFNIAQMLAA